MERIEADDTRALELPRAEFLAALAHELRTPLAALRVSFDLLRDPRAVGTDPGEHRRLAETIERSMERLERHVTDMLEIGYLKRHTLALHSERIDAETPVVAALDAIGQHAAQRRVSIDLTLEEDLPLFTADPGRLAQVLTNLLVSAIKFSPLDSSVGLRVSTAPAARQGAAAIPRREEGIDADEGAERAEEIVFSVSDRGPGIAEEHRRKIFWPFYEVPRRHGEGAAGTGLGLSIAQSLVELHGGRLWVESDGKEGAAFRFTIPIGQDDEDPGG